MAIVSRIITAAALFSLAIVSNAPTGVNAVSVHHVNNGRANHHELIAKAKRAENVPRSAARRCKPRTSTIASASSTSAAVTATTTQSGGSDPVTSSKPPVTTTKPATTIAKTTTTSAAAATTTASHPSGAGKVGLAWANGEDDHLGEYITDKTTFIYTWTPNCPANYAKYGIDCGRMLWGYKDLDTFRKVRETPGTTILMGMNEVNEPSQSYMTPAQGIALWNAEIRPFKKNGIRLLAPAVTSSPTGKAWLLEFFKNCGGNDKCGVDGLNVHWYDVSIPSFKAYMTDFHTTFGLNVWLTEFACQNFNNGPQCTPDFIPQFMSEVTSWMNDQPWIEVFCAFGILHDMWNVNYANQLMKADGSPTSLGYQFINS